MNESKGMAFAGADRRMYVRSFVKSFGKIVAEGDLIGRSGG